MKRTAPLPNRALKQKTIQLYDDQNQSLEILAAKTDLAVQEHIRRAIDQYLKKQK